MVEPIGPLGLLPTWPIQAWMSSSFILRQRPEPDLAATKAVAGEGHAMELPRAGQTTRPPKEPCRGQTCHLPASRMGVLLRDRPISVGVEKRALGGLQIGATNACMPLVLSASCREFVALLERDKDARATGSELAHGYGIQRVSPTGSAQTIRNQAGGGSPRHGGQQLPLGAAPKHCPGVLGKPTLPMRRSALARLAHGTAQGRADHQAVREFVALLERDKDVRATGSELAPTSRLKIDCTRRLRFAEPYLNLISMLVVVLGRRRR